MNVNQASGRDRFTLRLACGRTNNKTSRHTRLSLDDSHRHEFQSELSTPLSFQLNAQNSNKHREHIKESVNSVAAAT